jgi:hypothetical protein
MGWMDGWMSGVTWMGWDWIGFDQTFLYMTVLLHSLALVFLLTCGLVLSLLALLVRRQKRSCRLSGDAAKYLFICPVRWVS